MKIEGPKRPENTKSTKPKKSASEADSAGFSEAMSRAGSSEAPAQTQQSASIARVDSLLAAQSVEDPAERAARRRMRARAGNVLQELEKIRNALLSGRLTVGHIIDIADVVASHREKIFDPKLTAILDEVDLRAQIEIAKMRKALD